MATLEVALGVACRAHADQKDKGGKPYILHVLRVVLGCSSETAQIVAALHDVIEDCPAMLGEVNSAGFSSNVLDALTLLTRTPPYSYQPYIEALAGNAVAREVKIADLTDNLDRSRIDAPDGTDIKRWERYERSLMHLLAVKEANEYHGH